MTDVSVWNMAIDWLFFSFFSEYPETLEWERDVFLTDGLLSNHVTEKRAAYAWGRG